MAPGLGLSQMQSGVPSFLSRRVVFQWRGRGLYSPPFGRGFVLRRTFFRRQWLRLWDKVSQFGNKIVYKGDLSSQSWDQSSNVVPKLRT